MQDRFGSKPPEEISGKDLARRVVKSIEGGEQPLQHRLLFYLLGGLVVLLFLLALAQSFNPPDSALRDADMVLLLAPWDGNWRGQEVVRDVSGETLAIYDTTRSYFSASSTRQSAEIIRRSPSGMEFKEGWINSVLGNGLLRATTMGKSGEDKHVFEGRLEDGEVFWTRETQEATIVRRGRITGNQLLTEEVVFPKQPHIQATITTGNFTRQPAR